MEFKNINIIVNEDLTPISAKIISELKKTEKNGTVFTVIKKTTLFMWVSQKIWSKTVQGPKVG